MKAKEVPQEVSSMAEGQRRACYAEDEHGKYVVVQSKGWSVEDIVNAQANAEIDRVVEEARVEAFSGKVSPLKYHMLRRQMTPRLLASTAGFWRFQVKRHFAPKAFAALPSAILLRYAEALNITVEDLTSVPAVPQKRNVFARDISTKGSSAKEISTEKKSASK
ncbi:MAG: hypothetical protein HY884_03185 [Deltaproteobacteria bacterium]|nr:hypothetical protein [Deltaproteobacteria bacterium]